MLFFIKYEPNNASTIIIIIDSIAINPTCLLSSFLNISLDNKYIIKANIIIAEYIPI